jgi:hypothetical protein
MSYSDAIPNYRRVLAAGDVDNGGVLNICAIADSNKVAIAAQDAVEPYTRVFSNVNVANHRGVFGNERG